VTDVEHELLRENQAFRDRIAVLGDLARRALIAAIDAEERVHGTHAPWLDDELAAIDQELADPV
jgi:hypothetical protein